MIALPLSDVIAPVSGYLPPALLSPEGRQRLLELTERLPASLTSFFGFECPLWSSPGIVDFSVLVDYPDGCDLLTRMRESREPGTTLLAFGEWKNIREFCRACADPESSIHDLVHNFWLEFDLDGKAPEPLVPGCWAPLGTMPGRRPPDDPLADRNRRLVAAQDVVALLQGNALSAAIRSCVVRCFEMLPPDALPIHAAAVLSRRQSGVVIFLKMAFEEIGPYLGRIGWRGSAESIAEVRSLIGSSAERFHLAIDVRETVQPRIGIEFSFQHRTDSSRADRWQPLLTRLVDGGFCTPERRDGLVGWVGGTRVRFPHLWDETVMMRRISHIKVSIQPGSPLQFKGYLSCQLVSNHSP